jgi:hypothetical protein
MILPTDLLSEARSLASAARNNETRRRTVVGRAYYAAFHALLDAVSATGYNYPRNADPPGRHEHLIAWSMAHSDADIVTAAGLLQELKFFRRRADYALESHLNYTDMVDVLEKVAYLFEELLAGRF